MYLTSLCLSFFLCKMERVITPNVGVIVADQAMMMMKVMCSFFSSTVSRIVLCTS